MRRKRWTGAEFVADSLPWSQIQLQTFIAREKEGRFGANGGTSSTNSIISAAALSH